MRPAIKLLPFLLFGATLAGAQITLTPAVVVPAATNAAQGVVMPDGITAKVSNGILSCVQQSSAGVTYANGILTVGGVQVNVLSLTQLNLTGGTSLSNGQYLATFTNGALTWTPYVAPSGGVSTPGKAYTVAVPQQAGWGLNWYPVPGATATPGQTVSASPVFTGVPTTALNYVTGTVFVNSAGAVYLRVGNDNGTAFAATAWTVSVK